MKPDDIAQNYESAASSTHDEPPGEAGVLEAIQSLWNELYGLSHERLQLAALETRRAGQSLVTMIVAGVMLALLLSAAWLGLLVAIVYRLVENGLPASAAILIAVAFNLLLALMLCGIIRHRSRYLQFPASLRSLKPQTGQRSSGHQ